MIVRIRWRPQVYGGARLHAAALGLAALLTPLSLGAFTMSLWSIGAQLEWTGKFAIMSGTFSHWEVWMACAAILLLVARLLNRYGGGDIPGDASRAESLFDPADSRFK